MLDMLCMIDAPTSCEKSILKFIQTKLSCEAEYDAMGNLVAHKKGEGKKLMFYTSVDEDAFIVMAKDGRKVNFAHKGDKQLKKGDILSFDGYRAVAEDEKTCKILKDYELNTADVGCFYAPSYEDDGVLLSKEAASKLAISAMCEATKLDSDFDVYFVFGVKGKMIASGLVAAIEKIKPDELVIFESCEKDTLCFKLMAKGFSGNREMCEKYTEKYGVDISVDSEEATLGSSAVCEKIAVIGIPVENKDLPLQRCETKYKDEILALIQGELKNA